MSYYANEGTRLQNERGTKTLLVVRRTGSEV